MSSPSKPINPPFGWSHQVVGFIFSHDLEQVLLIRKKRPDWLKRRLNGIGGHLNDKEEKNLDFHNAFIRKAKEETGLELESKKLKTIGVSQIVNMKISLMIYAYKLDDLQIPEQQTDEVIAWYPVFRFPTMFCVPDILFLIPYARHTLLIDNLSMATLSISYE